MVDRVCGYIGRDAATFISGTADDNVLAALNDSRSSAQQGYDFQQLRVTGVISVNGAAGCPWGIGAASYGPYTSDSLSTPLRLKKVDSLWNYTKDSSGNMLPTNRIDFATEQQFKRLLPTNLGFPFTQTFPAFPPFYYNTIPTQQMFAYVIGPTLYVNTCNAPSKFMIRGLQKLADLTGAETSDFFIDNYQKWLLYATLQNLNGFLKEDQRVAISAALLNNAWNDVTFDDGGKGAQGEWSNLD